MRTPPEELNDTVEDLAPEAPAETAPAEAAPAEAAAQPVDDAADAGKEAEEDVQETVEVPPWVFSSSFGPRGVRNQAGNPRKRKVARQVEEEVEETSSDFEAGVCSLHEPCKVPEEELEAAQEFDEPETNVEARHPLKDKLF